MSLRTAKITIAVLIVALIGAMFLNFNLEAENRDLYRKIDALVALTKEAQMDKDNLEFQGARLKNELENMAARRKDDSLWKSSRSIGAETPQTNTPTNGALNNLSTPQSNPQQIPANPAATYPQKDNNASFEDLNKPH